MSEDSTPVAAESAPAEPSVPVKTARRVSNPRPKKVAKKVAAESAPEPQTVEPAAAAEAPVAPAPVPVREETPAANETPAREDSGARTHWPEPETIQGETAGPGGKRKRRRKKKGGANAHPNEGQTPRAQVPGSEGASLQAPARPAQPQSTPQPAPRVPFDLEEVSKKAWKIFLSEVSEEGLALIGDNDARDLTRRSFRLAEIFLEEKARRIR
jgi:hypothetical protein